MTSYDHGFIDKCAEYGIAPEDLMKVAGIGSMLGKAVEYAKANPINVAVPAAGVLSALGILYGAKQARKNDPETWRKLDQIAPFMFNPSTGKFW